MQTYAPSTWLLLDDRASHRAQVQGVAERLGWSAEVKEIRYNRLAALANRIAGARMWHLTPESRMSLQGPWPELVIAAGRRAAPVALAIKKISPHTRIVHLMWPDIAPAMFDLIAVPEHDTLRYQGANILRTQGSPHRVSPAKLNMEAARWMNNIRRLPKPRIALMVGGSTRHGIFSEADFRTLGAYASAETERLGGSLLISSSPRTGEAGEATIQSLLTVPNLFYRWKAEGDNPYLAFLGLADAVIVTGDSISMCSEVCAAGKPVYIFTPPHLVDDKSGFRASLFTRGYAKSHTFSMRLDWQPPPFPDAAALVADAIRTRLFGNYFMQETS